MFKCQCPNPRINGYNSKRRALITHQDLSLHNPEIYEEISDPSKFRHLIKDWCVYCGVVLPGTWLYYYRMGNSCSDCSVRHQKNIKKKK